MLFEDIRKKLNKPSSMNDVLEVKNEIKKEILIIASKNGLSVYSTIELLNELVEDLVYNSDQRITIRFIDLFNQLEKWKEKNDKRRTNKRDC